MNPQCEMAPEAKTGAAAPALSHATLERWFRVTPAILHSIGSDGRLIAVSDAWLAKFGYSREEALGEHAHKFLTPGSRAAAARSGAIEEFLRTGRADNVAYQMVCKDGRVLDVLISAVLDPGDAVQGRCSLSVITDVTELRQAERKLAESRALYERIVEDQADLVSLARPDGELTFVNRAYAQQYGAEPHELIGTNLLDYVPAGARCAVREQLQKVCLRDATTDTENQVVAPDGQKRWIAWTNRAIRDPDGRVTAIHSVGRDIDRRVFAESLLKDSEKRYRLLADNCSDMVTLVRADSRRIYVSPASEKLFGWSPDELLAQRIEDSIHPEDLPRFQETFAADRDAVVTLRYRIRHRNGTYVWVEAATQRVEIPGEQSHRIFVVRDIRDRIEAERSLKESEARYRMLAENSSDMVILARKGGQRRYVSPACYKLLGWTPEEMLAMTAKEMIHPEDYPKTWGAQPYEGPEHVTLTYRMRRKDGAFNWVEAASQRIEIEDDDPHRLVVIRNIEPRVEADRLVRESEAAYRLLAENSSDMVFKLDRDLVLRYVSPASRHILGNEPAEMIGLRPVEMAHPDDAERIKGAFAALVSGAADRQSPISRRRRRDGRWIWVEAQMTALRDPQSGAFCGIVGALRDITSRKLIEDQLAAANRRLEILAAEDALTGLANRRAFDETLAREHRRASREGGDLALIMIDVDRFKSFNDRFGHPAGDVCLQQVARAISGALRRPADFAARFGGEEFAVVLPNTRESGAAEVAQRIRLAVRELGLVNEPGVDGLVTISAGVAAMRQGESGAGVLVKGADLALYRAKEAGRDQVVNASWLPAGERPSEDAEPREVREGSRQTAR